MSSESGGPEWSIWGSDTTLPPNQLLKLLWRAPFWKGWGLSRLICCWITLGEFWLTWSRRGHTAVMEASSRWAGLIRGKALAWMCICMWAWTWARLNVCMTLTRGRFLYKCCVRPPVLPAFLNIGRDLCTRVGESGVHREHVLWKTTDSAEGVTRRWSCEQMSFFQSF